MALRPPLGKDIGCREYLAPHGTCTDLAHLPLSSPGETPCAAQTMNDMPLNAGLKPKLNQQTQEGGG